jgi:hypothetical protein
MKRNVEILSLKKNDIVYVVKLKKRKKINFSKINFVTFIVGVFAYFSLTSINYVSLVASVFYSPVNSLYNDSSEVVFTSGGDIQKEKFIFTIPNIGGDYEVLEDGAILICAKNSIMIKSCEDGIVDDVGVDLDGNKYIKINHGKKYQTIISGVDISGVDKGVIVKRGQDIATSQISHKIFLRIYENGVQVKNPKIEQNKIVWEN